MERRQLAITGVSCGHYVASVRPALGGLDGVAVEDVTVGPARVASDAARIHPDAIAGAVRDEGYETRIARA